jgi:hypothetical protein
MPTNSWLESKTPAFRLMIATSWLAPDSFQKNQEQAIRKAVEAGVDWPEYLSLVDRHRIPALSWTALGRVPGVSIPEFVRHELQTRNHACRMEAVTLCLLLADVLKSFDRSLVRAMPLKGQLLSFELYGDIGLRHSKDLDICVAQEDLSSAWACLEKMGWHVNSSSWFPLSPKQYESFLKNEHHLEFLHPGCGQALELHWRSRWENHNSASKRWTRSIPIVWRGCSFWTMNSVDKALYLFDHGGEHVWQRAKWLGDLARFHAMAQLDWKEVWAEARKTGQERILLIGLILLNQLYELSLPDLPGDPWKEVPPSLIRTSLLALSETGAIEDRPIAAEIRQRLREARFYKQSRPKKAWRESFRQLLYYRDDFNTIRLPDSFFWAYMPLYPILWIRRRPLPRILKWVREVTLRNAVGGES